MAQNRTKWNLDTVYVNKGTSTKLQTNAEVDKAINLLKKEALKFTDKWRKRNDYLQNPKTLKTALDEYEK